VVVLDATVVSMLSCAEVLHVRKAIAVTAHPLISHVSRWQEEVPSLRTEHKGIASSYGPCAHDAFACTKELVSSEEYFLGNHPIPQQHHRNI
jgi:hypothetical protein